MCRGGDVADLDHWTGAGDPAWPDRVVFDPAGTGEGLCEAIFSGLTTNELAEGGGRAGTPRSELHGLYHVGAEPISKYYLLEIVKTVYQVLNAGCQGIPR